MNGRWDQKGLPHKGWSCDDVIDLGSDEAMDDSDYATCKMCGQERVRYVHVMSHPDLSESISVGCICAGKMNGDYEGAKRRETTLKNKAARKAKWLSRKWRTSMKGNPFINVDGQNLGIHKSKTRWGYRIGKNFGPDLYPTVDEAKLALFEAYWQKINSDDQENSN